MFCLACFDIWVIGVYVVCILRCIAFEADVTAIVGRDGMDASVSRMEGNECARFRSWVSCVCI